MNSWLTNALRPYFGLEVLEEHWDVVEIKEGYFICVDGDVIRKRISSTEDTYGETDVEIFTRDRAFVLPKTARGKEKAELHKCFEHQGRRRDLFSRHSKGSPS